MTSEMKRFDGLVNLVHERPGDVFMKTLDRDGLVVAPGVFCANGSLTARDVYEKKKAANEPCAFNAVYGSGWAISAILWGRPDYGFHDLSEMKVVCRPIVSAAHPLPVILDAETGFGNYVTMPRTVEAYHEMGVALAHLEDQEAVRRCGNLGGKSCVEPEEMVTKIRSWLSTSAQIGTSMRLMVRTDALTASNGGLKDALDRGKRYMDTEYRGLRPTVLWADAMMDRKTIDTWIDVMHKHDPKMILGINYSPNKDWTGHYKKEHNSDPPTYDDLYRNGEGFRVIWHTILQARAAMEATWDTFDDMARNGAKCLWTLHERQRQHPVGDPQRMSNIVPVQAYEKRIGGAQAEKRFDASQGYKS